jgi:hypothetical protein
VEQEGRIELRLEEDRIHELHLANLQRRVLGDDAPRSPTGMLISVDQLVALAYNIEPDEDNERARAEWSEREQQRRSQRG